MCSQRIGFQKRDDAQGSNEPIDEITVHRPFLRDMETYLSVEHAIKYADVESHAPRLWKTVITLPWWEESRIWIPLALHVASLLVVGNRRGYSI